MFRKTNARKAPSSRQNRERRRHPKFLACAHTACPDNAVHLRLERRVAQDPRASVYFPLRLAVRGEHGACARERPIAPGSSGNAFRQRRHQPRRCHKGHLDGWDSNVRRRASRPGPTAPRVQRATCGRSTLGLQSIRARQVAGHHEHGGRPPSLQINPAIETFDNLKHILRAAVVNKAIWTHAVQLRVRRLQP